MQIARVTKQRLKVEFDKLITFFNERDNYKKELKGWIKKYGLANLSASVLRTVPTDRKVLYEIIWYLQPIVWFRIIQMTWLNAENEGLRMAKNG